MAVETGKKIIQENITADEILYSPLLRAADPAKYISEIIGIPMRMEPGLMEQNFGIWDTREYLQGDEISVSGVTLLIEDIAHDGTVVFSVVRGKLCDQSGNVIESATIGYREKEHYQ